MSTLSPIDIATALEPYLIAFVGQDAVPVGLFESLAVYLDLLVRWNGRTNLTAVRDPPEMVTRHFGESLFAGAVLMKRAGDSGGLLDLGSGAGFPGLPIALLLPGWRITLAESQRKKAAFLQEAVRTLGVSAEVWAGRAQDMPAPRRFDAVTLRAVDDPERARTAALQRVLAGGHLLELVTSDPAGPMADDVPVPLSERRCVRVTQV